MVLPHVPELSVGFLDWEEGKYYDGLPAQGLEREAWLVWEVSGCCAYFIAEKPQPRRYFPSV